MARPRILGGPRRFKHRYGAQQVAMPDVEQSINELHARQADWQKRVLKYADLVPEVKKGGKFVYNVLDRVTFEIERFNRRTNEWEPDNSPEMQGLERRINLAFKAGRAGELGHFVEECFILVTRNEENDFEFETLSPSELRRTGKKVEKRIEIDGEKDQWTKVKEGTTIIRVWTPDAENRFNAGGPHKPLLNLLETMALELMADQADAVSVLAGAGILLIPTEILPDETDTLDASDTPGSRKGFEDRLEEAMMLPITDRKRGEAIVPLALYGEADVLDKVRHLTLNRRDKAAEKQARMDDYVRRYAHNIDLPAEVILGTGDTNHWSGWKVDENTWAYHLEPRAQQIADAIYAGVLRGVVINLGRDADEHRLVPNASAAIAKTDKSGNAKDAYALGAITVEAYVENIGLDDDDIRPDADELLVASITGGGGVSAVDEAVRAAPPQRTAAARSSQVTLRMAAKAANSQQAKLEKLMRSILERVARDAAAAGRVNQRKEKEFAASTGQKVAAEIPFLGYEPGVYFARYADDLAKLTGDALFGYLRRIATLTNTDYRQLRSVWASEYANRVDAVSKQAQTIAEDIASQSFAKGKEARVLNSQVRTLTSQANGGANVIDRGAKNVDRPTHAGEDASMRDTLTDTVGDFATEYTWVTGHPMQPFPAHQKLDGLKWFSWQEFDKLDVSDDNHWLPGSVYFPGDHAGCQCSYEIDFVER